MFPTLLLGCLLTAPQTTKIDLFRGAPVSENGYWAVEDTTIDIAAADKNFGGLFTLEGGKGKAVLIKFGDLESAIPANARIVSASLILAPSSSERPEFSSCEIVQVPWGEGPMLSTSASRSAEPTPIKLSATWKQSRNGSLDWQQAGATGPQDATPITGAKMVVRDKEIAITGLAAAVQTMKDRWYLNHGFAIRFQGRCEFYSSQAKNGKPRLELEYIVESRPTGSDLSVQWIDRIGSGDSAGYAGIVKNVGSVTAKPFQARWVVGDRAGSQFGVNKALAPGEETVIELKKGYRAIAGDARTQAIQLQITPGEPEANTNNDALEIHEDALAIGFQGAKIDADALQAIARTINRVYFPQSRFSFAVDGVKERIRLVSSQDNADFVVDLAGGPGATSVVRLILAKLTGIAPSTNEGVIAMDGQSIPFQEPYPGVSGFGDTRFEGLIPPGIPMLYQPVASPLFESLPIEPTRLLSGTEVAALNAAIGVKSADRFSVLWDLPATVILRTTDMTGKPLDGAELAFFQLDGATVPSSPVQTILTKDGGTVILENRDVPASANDRALHILKRNPFGNLKPDGSNGTFLIRAQVNGEVEWGWLKSWQLTDSFHRGNKAAAVIDVRFNAPSGRLDRSVNLAAGRLLTDKANNLPARLAGAVDDNLETSAVLGPSAGDWIEVDLGRDRPIGEVVVVPKNGVMPSRFDIQAYSTGQTAPEKDAWVKDLDYPWTRTNRQRSDGSIPYRGPLTRARFIRIINRSGGPGDIVELKVYPVQANP